MQEPKSRWLHAIRVGVTVLFLVGLVGLGVNITQQANDAAKIGHRNSDLKYTDKDSSYEDYYDYFKKHIFEFSTAVFSPLQLWVLGRQVGFMRLQADIMKTQADISRKQALIARSQADALDMQNSIVAQSLDIAIKQKEISRLAVINASRPYLILEVNEWVSDRWSHQSTDEPFFLFFFTNHGNAPAIVKETLFGVVITDKIDELVVNEDFSAFSYEVILQGKATKQFKAEASRKSIETLLSDVREHRAFVFAYGKFIYEGMSGVTHETRFCWKYDLGSETFHEYGGEKYNRRI